MDGSTAISVSLLIGIVGCFIGLAGWLKGRDNSLKEDSEWKGSVNAKLDMIVGVKEDVSELNDSITKLIERMALIESSTKQAHKRLDEHIQKSTH